MKTLRIGIDSYGLYLLQLDPLEILQWAKNNGAEGVQISGLSPEEMLSVDTAYLRDLVQYTSSHNLYLEWGGGEHIPFDANNWVSR